MYLEASACSATSLEPSAIRCAALADFNAEPGSPDVEVFLCVLAIMWCRYTASNPADLSRAGGRKVRGEVHAALSTLIFVAIGPTGNRDVRITPIQCHVSVVTTTVTSGTVV